MCGAKCFDVKLTTMADVGRVCKVHTIGSGAVGGVGDVVRRAGGLERLVVILRRGTVL
jgi:hypothetical protein